ncbi:uncharacterized protein VTP21DRAFT_10343 [Calcarisporiella thermophila]|uniref:uncharacterized protein n=1 Tax=Calcarisporiella thermophila TaxID=911321 RepID=UPI00374255AD
MLSFLRHVHFALGFVCLVGLLVSAGNAKETLAVSTTGHRIEKRHGHFSSAKESKHESEQKKPEKVRGGKHKEVVRKKIKSKPHHSLLMSSHQREVTVSTRAGTTIPTSSLPSTLPSTPAPNLAQASSTGVGPSSPGSQAGKSQDPQRTQTLFESGAARLRPAVVLLLALVSTAVIERLPL